MLNRLAVCGDCQTAFYETAESLGFAVSREQPEIEGHECSSLEIAHAILQKTAPARAEELFKELRADVKAYQKQLQSKNVSSMRMRAKDKCDHLGIIVMDFMLQLIEAESYEVVPVVNQVVAR